MTDSGIAVGEWLTELARLSKLSKKNEGLTKRELVAALGVGPRALDRFLQQGCDTKRIIAKRAMRHNVVGILTPTVVYSLAPKEAE